LHVNKNAVAGLGGDLWITNQATNTIGNISRLAFDPSGTTDPTPACGIECVITNVGSYLSDLVFKFYDGSAYNEKLRIHGDTGDVVMVGHLTAPGTPRVYTGTAAPATTPAYVGDLFVDTNAKKIYSATGTSSSADWTILN
jgi:hypothetical protein